MKRTLSFITAVSLFLGVFLFSSPAAADGEIYVTPTQYQTQYYSQGTFSQIQKITNVDNFREYLNNGFRKCNKRIDLSSFNIPATDANFDAIWDLIFDEMPEAFHVSNGSLTYNASKIMYIMSTALQTKKMHELYEECKRIGISETSDVIEEAQSAEEAEFFAKAFDIILQQKQKNVVAEKRF